MLPPSPASVLSAFPPHSCLITILILTQLLVQSLRHTWGQLGGASLCASFDNHACFLQLSELFYFSISFMARKLTLILPRGSSFQSYTYSNVQPIFPKHNKEGIALYVSFHPPTLSREHHACLGLNYTLSFLQNTSFITTFDYNFIMASGLLQCMHKEFNGKLCFYGPAASIN
ncbi:hypothetical protein EGR_10249 [Echinococcus granulosus]|uniref:Uncharacterized protein n=1 Tax=Echinococcus granulosus TaxID=6210 RepID=W6U1G6_ECHGR|nr:hypothetical protein EGR_10249 [Echinococcus granulosus]EUB54888.1 hypothetical protein EGR_10249 [Echinococcus granulosus]